jgi:hypothetical protein
MRKRFHVTYEIVSHASAEHGDVEERGYAMPHGWKFELDTMSDEDIKTCALDLRSAAGMVNYVQDCGRWFAEIDGDEDYKTGDVTFYSLHPPENITAASYRRLSKLLKAHH